MTGLEWKQWGRNLHTAPGELKGEPGTWRVVKPIAQEPWEVWFRNRDRGPGGGHRRGKFVARPFKTAAEAKTAVEALNA
jgi:hypothetical protein